MFVGNYTLSQLLGRGGTSEVYAAEHRFLGDAVAVKLLRPAQAHDEQVREAFVEEAARTREIQHPNVIRVIDFGHDPTTDSCYLVMERIEGESLSARLRRGGPLAEPVLRTLAAAVADGMQAAHARGIVHRDLKPGNIMLRGETPIVVDFGIAKSLGAGSAVVTERRIGTLAYMAPEQLAEGLITPAVDIWALGVILYEAATGRAPFESFNEGRLPQLFETPPRASTLASITPPLDELIMRCLARDPSKRPLSMAHIARALRGEADAIGEERVTEDIGPPRAQKATPPLNATPPRSDGAGGAVAAASPARRSRMFVGVTAAALLGAGVLAIVMWPAARTPSAASASSSPGAAGQTPSATASGAPGQTPSATASGAPGQTPSATASGAPGQTPPATAAGTPGQTPSATAASAPGQTPSATASGAPGQTPSATASGATGQPPRHTHGTKRTTRTTAAKPHAPKPGPTKTPTTSQGETLD